MKQELAETVIEAERIAIKCLDLELVNNTGVGFHTGLRINGRRVRAKSVTLIFDAEKSVEVKLEYYPALGFFEGDKPGPGVIVADYLDSPRFEDRIPTEDLPVPTVRQANP